jgi:ribose transport system ATP-binding protein
LFEEIKHLKSDGHSVVFVSHRLDEVLEISDRIYVFKDGMVNGNLKKDDANNAKLYELMVGRVTPIEYYHLEQQIKPAEEIVLQVKELGLKGAFKYVSFDLHRGEIIGFCGTVGSGKEDLCHVLCGDDKQTEGRILLKNKKHELQHVLFNNPNEALMEGIIMIPKERLEEGVIANLSIDENIALSSYKHLTNGPFIIGPKKDKQSDEWIKKLRIKTAGREELLSQLSGGNQQKVVFARALASESEIIILNHPTRGVDVGAKEEIYAMIRECAKMGKSIILLGDTLEECIGMSNRILVMKDGVVTGELKAEADSKPSQVQIVSLMM